MRKVVSNADPNYGGSSKAPNRHFPDNLQIQKNRITVPPLSWYASDAYRSAIPTREQAMDAVFIVVEDPPQ